VSRTSSAPHRAEGGGANLFIVSVVTVGPHPSLGAGGDAPAAWTEHHPAETGADPHEVQLRPSILCRGGRPVAVMLGRV
jgi:hypothetical protein